MGIRVQRNLVQYSKEDIESGKSELAWQQPVNNYDENLYEVERLKIIARDDTKVPVSLVYKKGTDLSQAPILILWLWFLWHYY